MHVANEGSVSPVGEPLMTRSAGNFISGEVVRNKRSAQWAVAPIENAECAEGKRPEFVSAKRAQTPLQGVCATIERTESNPAGITKNTEVHKGLPYFCVCISSRIVPSGQVFYAFPYSFFASHPRKSPPSNREMMRKKISAKMMKTNEGIRMRVYFFPLPVPLRI